MPLSRHLQCNGGRNNLIILHDLYGYDKAVAYDKRRQEGKSLLSNIDSWLRKQDGAKGISPSVERQKATKTVLALSKKIRRTIQKDA
jgi:hypothetical protein